MAENYEPKLLWIKDGKQVTSDLKSAEAAVKARLEYDNKESNDE
jgi:hypothetical protein